MVEFGLSLAASNFQHVMSNKISAFFSFLIMEAILQLDYCVLSLITFLLFGPTEDGMRN